VTESTDHVGRLLRDCFRRFQEELAEATAAVRERYGLRPVHDQVLAYLDVDGTRASVLATRSRLTRQAITQLVDELEELGVVARHPDPEDGRAKIVRYTPQAAAALRRSRKAIGEIEQRWADELGEEAYAALRRGLERLSPGVDQDRRG
jgi:DNA-binding MarR family transcriptional regulator